jgi:hypothetical protein
MGTGTINFLGLVEHEQDVFIKEFCWSGLCNGICYWRVDLWSPTVTVIILELSIEIRP